MVYTRRKYGIGYKRVGCKSCWFRAGGKICYDYPNGTTELPKWNRGESHAWSLQLQGYSQLMHCRMIRNFLFKKQ